MYFHLGPVHPKTFHIPPNLFTILAWVKVNKESTLVVKKYQIFIKSLPALDTNPENLPSSNSAFASGNSWTTFKDDPFIKHWKYLGEKFSKNQNRKKFKSTKTCFLSFSAYQTSKFSKSKNFFQLFFQRIFLTRSWVDMFLEVSSSC